jgi:hypothetical protein
MEREYVLPSKLSESNNKIYYSRTVVDRTLLKNVALVFFPLNIKKLLCFLFYLLQQFDMGYFLLQNNTNPY